MGKRVIGQSIAYGLDEAFKLDPQYYRSEKKGIGARAGHAILSTFTERRPSGKRVIAVPRLVGNYAANVIAVKTWYPDRFTAKDGLRSATIGLAFGAFYNLIREFVHK
jgi:hypothetical protein